MIKLNKKGKIFFATVLAILFLVMLIPMAVNVSFRRKERFNNFIGESQLLLLNTYDKGEKGLFYIEESGSLSLKKVLQDINNNGFSTECDTTVDGYALLNTETVACYPDVKEYVKQQVDVNLKKYFDLYTEHIPSIEYDYLVKQDDTTLTIVARSSKSLRMDINSESVYNFKIDELQLDAGSVDSDGGAPQPGVVSGECSYCYYSDYSNYWQSFVKKWDADAGCSDKCCKAKCPPGAKILEVPYTNQCEIKYGNHPNAEPSNYGWGNSDACLAMCGPTAVQMLNDYYKGGYDLRNVNCDWARVKASCNHWYDGAYRGMMPGVLKDETGKSFEIRGLALSAIKANIDQGKPVITGLYIPGGCPQSSKYTYYCWDGMGHIFTVVGYAPGYIILNDPYTDHLGNNKEWSHNIVIPESAFTSIWSGESVFLS